jgi:hypothetical protein
MFLGAAEQVARLSANLLGAHLRFHWEQLRPA